MRRSPRAPRTGRYEACTRCDSPFRRGSIHPGALGSIASAMAFAPPAATTSAPRPTAARSAGRCRRRVVGGFEWGGADIRVCPAVQPEQIRVRSGLRAVGDGTGSQLFLSER